MKLYKYKFIRHVINYIILNRKFYRVREEGAIKVVIIQNKEIFFNSKLGKNLLFYGLYHQIMLHINKFNDYDDIIIQIISSISFISRQGWRAENCVLATSELLLPLNDTLIEIFIEETIVRLALDNEKYQILEIDLFQIKII